MFIATSLLLRCYSWTNAVTGTLRFHHAGCWLALSRANKIANFIIQMTVHSMWCHFTMFKPQIAELSMIVFFLKSEISTEIWLLFHQVGVFFVASLFFGATKHYHLIKNLYHRNPKMFDDFVISYSAIVSPNCGKLGLDSSLRNISVGNPYKDLLYPGWGVDPIYTTKFQLKFECFID